MERFELDTPAYGFVDITARVRQIVRESGVEEGLCVVYCPHTTAAITINENADPDVRLDFAAFFDRIVPDGASYFKHIYEGDDDMSAHIKASLLGASLTIPIRGRALDLGTWQGIYLCEFRNGGGARRVTVTIVE